MGLKKKAKVMSFDPGPVIVLSSDIERARGISGMFKVKEMKWTGEPSTVRVYFDLQGNQTGSNARAQIYVNDVARGTIRSKNTGYVTFTEDIQVNTNDLISLIYWTTIEGYNVFCKNFRIGIQPFLGTVTLD